MVKKIEKQKAIELRKDGLAITVIAKKLNVSKASVSEWVRHLPATEEMRKKFIESRSINPSLKTKKKISKSLKKYWKNNPKEKKWTKDYINKYSINLMKKKYHEMKKWSIDYLGGKCNKCGTFENLTFDHINPFSKKYDIAKIMCGKKEKLINELKKCQILCEKCHKAKNKIDGSTFKNIINGENINTSKLKEIDVINIKNKIKLGKKDLELSKEYKVSRSNISSIRNNRTWKHINL